MKIIVMGTGGFAVPTFQRILDSRHEVLTVVTMPLRSVRAKKTVDAPVRQLAQSHNCTILDPENVNDPEFLPILRQFDADLIFVCDYGKILSPDLIALTRHGGINLHGSLLPKYRGAAPINHALWRGEPTVGVSVIHITPLVDAGPIVAQSEPLKVLESDTAVEIEEKLSRIGADLVMQVIESIENSTIKPIEQLEQLATKAPKLKKSDGQIDWIRSAEEIFWQYQALQPWPKIHTTLYRENREPMDVILDTIKAIPDHTDQRKTAKPGEIISADKDQILVAAGQGTVQILSLQPAGKKIMDTASFLRGHPVKPGDRLGERNKE